MITQSSEIFKHSSTHHFDGRSVLPLEVVSCLQLPCKR